VASGRGEGICPCNRRPEQPSPPAGNAPAAIQHFDQRLQLTLFTRAGQEGNIYAVPKLHFIVAVGLLSLWTGIPALACLPNPQMTPSEMACCKKMAGDCRMSNVEHPCCKTIYNAPASVASVQPISHVPPDFAAVSDTVSVHTPFESQSQSGQIALDLPPPDPPDQNSILRI
jgi:hypothetical protein